MSSEATNKDSATPEHEVKSVLRHADHTKTSKEKLQCEVISINDSNYPSYTNLELPYRVICRQRYFRTGAKYRKQFTKELNRQEAMQFRALDGIRIRREFCDPIIDVIKPKEVIKLSPKDQFKLDKILNREF